MHLMVHERTEKGNEWDIEASSGIIAFLGVSGLSHNPV